MTCVTKLETKKIIVIGLFKNQLQKFKLNKNNLHTSKHIIFIHCLFINLYLANPNLT